MIFSGNCIGSTLTAINFVAIVATIIVTVAHPLRIGQTMLILAQKALAPLLDRFATDRFVTVVNAMLNAVANILQRNAKSIQDACIFGVRT